jgi:ferritin-like metal-binding protein YciE
MKLDTLRELFEEQLADVYSAEKQIVEALPKMAQGASAPALVEAIENHLDQSKDHVSRIEEVFEQLGKKPQAKECKGMKGLLAEGSEMLKEARDPDVRDAGIIAAAQRVEHYEIAAYGTLCAYAEQLGQDGIAETLRMTLDEEKDADEKLSEIALEEVNVAAEDSGSSRST